MMQYDGGMRVKLLAVWFSLACASGSRVVADEPVLKAVIHLRKIAETNGGKTTGDALADHYVQSLADYCVKENLPAKEYLLALGVGLDKSDFLRRHPLTRGTFKTMGSDEERDKRKAALGEPTLRKRPDWLLHFALSASLTEAVNAEVAEQLGWYEVKVERRLRIIRNCWTFAANSNDDDSQR